MKHISFLLDDAIRPGAVFDLDGNDFTCESTRFVKNSFLMEREWNIKEFFIIRSADSWDDSHR